MVGVPSIKGQLRKMWPRAPQAIIDGYESEWPKVAARFSFLDRGLCAHIWGQFSQECGEGTELRENLRYSAKRIVQVFGGGSAKVSAAEAATLAFNPYGLGERVYGLGNPHMAANLGNTKTGDGYYARGTGPLNTTGMGALSKIAQQIGRPEILLDLEKWAVDPIVSLWIGAQDYVNLGAREFALKGDTHGETVRINGGTNGLADREAEIAKWMAYFKDAPMEDEGSAVIIVQPIDPKSEIAKAFTGKAIEVPATPRPVVVVSAATQAQGVAAHPIDLGFGAIGLGAAVTVSQHLNGYPPSLVAGVVVVICAGIWVAWASLRHR